MRRTLTLAVAAAALVALVAAILALPWALATPSNDREWSPDQALLPEARFQDGSIHIRNVRDFRYRSAGDYERRYDDRTYDLDLIEAAWLGVVPFDTGWRGPAHTFLSFGFSDGQYVAVSVEVRREVGERYSPFGGLFPRYELMYVIGDERDVVGLRTHHRQDPVYLYPIRAPRERIRALFAGLLRRANRLRNEPEFYHTVANNCTTNLVRHVNELVPGRIPFSLKVLLPAYSDRLAYDLGLIDTELPFEEAKEHFRIDIRARESPVTNDFSLRVRRAESNPGADG